MVRRIAATAAGELLEREEALRSLTAALDGAAQGHGAVVVITGEPGIGKTALVARFTAEVTDQARVLIGVCDDLATPRPLGPFRDLTEQLPGQVGALLALSTPPGDLAMSLVRELRQARHPTILVIEDVHWVDQATIDVLTVLGRRAADLPLLLVLTARPGELDPGDPLRGAIETMRRGTVCHLELAPLTRAAVARLADDGVGRLAGNTVERLAGDTVERLGSDEVERIQELGRGNPFFVTELIAHGHDPPPPSLANAVLGRVGRLDPATRQLLELISVVPGRVAIAVLDRLDPAWGPRAEQAERRRILDIDHRHVRFHHELTRAAIHASLPWGRRRHLHGRILDVLLELDADPADVVHHAEAAGREALTASYALLAGERAAAAGAHREALAHLQRAADLGRDLLTAAEQATLQEGLAHSAWLTGRIDESLTAIAAAVRLATDLDDVVRLGRCTALQARIHWFSGDGTAAWRDARDAVQLLESGGPSAELARATAQAAELSMLVSRIDDALRWGERALQLGGGEDDLRLRALAAIGGGRLQLDVEAVDDLQAAVTLAHDTADWEQAVFTLVTLAVLHLMWVRPDVARSSAQQARDLARDHDFDAMAAFVDGVLAWLDLREGSPDAAAALSRARTGSRPDGAASIADQQTRLVLAERAVRDGAADAAARLRDASRGADRTRKLVHIAPVLELEVERALTEGTPLPVARFDALPAIVGHQPLRAGCLAARIAAWATLCGRSVRFDGNAPTPYAAMLERDWQAAADAFGAVGWHHDRGLLLSLLDDRDALTEALAIARHVAAGPLEARVCRRLRSLGLPVPRGPRASTQANPAQLTERQLEVLQHVASGRTNGQIAEVLHISPRTVEHHVAAILTKLCVASRAQAVARAAELGVP